MKATPVFLLIFFAIVLLNSCLGATADITIRADGSGRIALEYRVSQMLEAMGRLDGNERWPAIPVGRADFERSLARIPGLRLSSFSAQNAPGVSGGNDLVTKAVVEFRDTAALAAFLDNTGSNVSFVQNNGNPAGRANLLRLVVLAPPGSAVNTDLLALLREVSAGYEIGISLSAPRDANLTLSPPSVAAARLVSHGKKVSFAIALGELLALNEGLSLEFSW